MGKERDEFLDRCANIYDSGLAQPNLFQLMRNWLDFVMRFEHTMFSSGQSQGNYVLAFLADEQERLGGRYTNKTLANDKDGYALQQIAAILSHPCQECAVDDPNAWWTRTGFCNHKGNRR